MRPLLRVRDPNLEPHIMTEREFGDRRAVADLVETYRQGFLHLDPERLESIWDRGHVPLIYVAMERPEPILGWSAIAG